MLKPELFLNELISEFKAEDNRCLNFSRTIQMNLEEETDLIDGLLFSASLFSEI